MSFTQEELKPQLLSAFKAFAAFGSGSGTPPAKVCSAHEATRSVSAHPYCVHHHFAPIIDKCTLARLACIGKAAGKHPLCLHTTVINCACPFGLQLVLYGNSW